MNVYKIKIVETLEKIVVVSAKSEQEHSIPLSMIIIMKNMFLITTIILRLILRDITRRNAYLVLKIFKV